MKSARAGSVRRVRVLKCGAETHFLSSPTVANSPRAVSSLSQTLKSLLQAQSLREMAPKKALASKRKGNVGESSTERRRKRRNEPESPPYVPSPLSGHISMGNRPVTTGRKVYFNFLEEEHFNIGYLLKAQGWERFCTLEEPVYPRLVRLFYENMTIGSGQLVSMVEGVQIIMDERLLCSLLEMPREGMSYLNVQDRLEALKVVLEDDDTSDIGNVRASKLSAEMRLLHSMSSRIFFPKTGRFDWVTEKDIAFMYYLVKGRKMNLPFMMMNQMKDAQRKSKACLPYGMVFTLIFRYFEVDCSREDAKKLLHTDRYTEGSLHRMGYLKVQGRWVKKISGQAAATDSSSEEESEEEGQARAPEPEAGGPSVMHDSPRTPPPEPAQTSSFSGVTQEQFAQFTQSLTAQMSSMLLGVKDDIIGRMNEISAVTQRSFQEIREDIRLLSLRVDMVEVGQRSGTSTFDVDGLRSELEKIRMQVETLTHNHQGEFGSVHQGISRLESEFAALQSRLMSTTLFAQPIRAVPQQIRPPFRTYVRSGTGFPSSGPSSRTRTRGASSSATPSRTPTVEFVESEDEED